MTLLYGLLVASAGFAVGLLGVNWLLQSHHGRRLDHHGR